MSFLVSDISKGTSDSLIQCANSRFNEVMLNVLYTMYSLSQYYGNL